MENDVNESIYKENFGCVCAILPWRRESYWVAYAIVITSDNVTKWKYETNTENATDYLHIFAEKSLKTGTNSDCL